MSNGKYQNKYRIPSARALWHDYNGGAYFITVRTKNGIHYFRKIDELSLIGQYLYKTIQEVSTCFPHFFKTPSITLVNTETICIFGCPK